MNFIVYLFDIWALSGCKQWMMDGKLFLRKYCICAKRKTAHLKSDKRALRMFIASTHLWLDFSKH